MTATFAAIRAPDPIVSPAWIECASRLIATWKERQAKRMPTRFLPKLHSGYGYLSIVDTSTERLTVMIRAFSPTNQV
jgi:hypothetical protein